MSFAAGFFSWTRLLYPYLQLIVHLSRWRSFPCHVYPTLHKYPSIELSLFECAAFRRRNRAALRARGIILVWPKRGCKSALSRSLMRHATLDSRGRQGSE